MSQVVSTLLEQQNWILDGLKNGNLVRIGGVIRKAAGTTGGGQIVAFLQEVAPTAITAVNPMAGLALKFSIGAVQTGVKVYTEHKTQTLLKEGFNVLNNKIDEGFATTHKSLSSILNISSVGAAASVLNLGLTVVGFAILNHKMNNLQKSFSFLNSKVDNIEKSLSGISNILVEINYLQYLHSKDLSQILSDIYGIETSILLEHISEIRMVTDNLRNYNQIKGKNISSYIDTLTTNRYWFEGMVENKLNQSNEERILSMLNYYRGWAMSSASEIQALRISNSLEKSANLAFETQKRSKEFLKEFSNKLLPTSEFGGTKRFGYHKFKENNLLLPEQINRLIFLQEGKEISKNLILNSLIDGGNLVSKYNPSEEWLKKQVFLGNILDTVEEINERLESYYIETKFCNENKLGYIEWEGN